MTAIKGMAHRAHLQCGVCKVQSSCAEVLTPVSRHRLDGVSGGWWRRRGRDEGARACADEAAQGSVRDRHDVGRSVGVALALVFVHVHVRRVGRLGERRPTAADEVAADEAQVRYVGSRGTTDLDVVGLEAPDGPLLRLHLTGQTNACSLSW